jgi:hypothetical protein
MAFLEEVSGTIRGIICGTISYFFGVNMPCDQHKTGTGLRFLVDAHRSRRPCRLSPLASAATIIAAFSTAAFS